VIGRCPTGGVFGSTALGARSPEGRLARGRAHQPLPSAVRVLAARSGATSVFPGMASSPGRNIVITARLMTPSSRIRSSTRANDTVPR
jgi:hypothetical protein